MSCQTAQPNCANSPDLSVILPVFNEQAVLPDLFSALESQVGLTLELVFSDGGSNDATCSLILDYQKQSRHRVVLVQGPQGRSRQLNLGARQANGFWLLFLHADSQWGASDLFLRAIEKMEEYRCQNGDRVAGHFYLQFSGRHKRPRFYRYLAEKSALNLPGTFFGDQGLLVTRSFWHHMGGYLENLPVLEDVELTQRISHLGRIELLPLTLETSSRRYEQDGIVSRQIFNAILLLIFASGQWDLLSCVMGSYGEQHGFTRSVLTLARQLSQLTLSAWLCFWYGCGSGLMRYLWVIPFRIYWSLGRCSNTGRQLVEQWNVIVLTRVDNRFWHTVAAFFLILLFYLMVVLSMPWWAGKVFHHRLSSARGEIDEFDL
nr:TIGR04283 family arsenosugar biosynthesis glycosyltransferase [uncultured Desulfuromonas sp.]